MTFASTGNKVMDDLIAEHGIVTIKGLDRGPMRKKVKRKMAS